LVSGSLVTSGTLNCTSGPLNFTTECIGASPDPDCGFCVALLHELWPACGELCV
jgi:hypothetical protein